MPLLYNKIKKVLHEKSILKEDIEGIISDHTWYIEGISIDLLLISGRNQSLKRMYHSDFLSTITFYFVHSKNNSQVEYEQRILTGIVAYAIIVYQYIRNLSNNFSRCCEASDIY